MEKRTGRRADRNRQAILDAARRIITRYGIQSLSIRNLAEEAEYSPSTLYRYFRDKEEILDALAGQAWQMAAEQSSDLPSDSASLEIVLQSGMQLYRFACSHPMEYQLMISSTSSSPKSMPEFMEDEKFIGVRTFLGEAEQSGEISIPAGFSSDLLALQLWFTVHGAAMMRTGLMSTFGTEVDQWMETLLEALRSQLSLKK